MRYVDESVIFEMFCLCLYTSCWMIAITYNVRMPNNIKIKYYSSNVNQFKLLRMHSFKNGNDKERQKHFMTKSCLYIFNIVS